MGTEILVLIVLILLNAFFAASEIALISLNDNKIKVMADSGHKKAKMLYALLDEPSRFLATIQIGITLAGFLASAFAAGSFSGKLAGFLVKLGMPLSESILETISVIVITLLLSYFTLVLGELVPKRLAMQKAEAIAMAAATPLTMLSKITSPFVKFLTLSTNIVVRLFGVDPKAEDEKVTEEEIRMMIDVGRENGTIQDSEKQMINNIFEFDNKTVSDIMTHRTNINAIPIDLSLKETLQIVNQEKYTRIPVYEENFDHIIGILHLKDLVQFIESGDRAAFNLRELIREPYYVLESVRIDQLFRDMQKNNIHMAVALDEYGGTDGIVTIEDLIEEIVGNIFDEYDEPELDGVEIEKVDETNFLLAGTINLYEVEELLKVELPTEKYDTLSGFVLGQLGYIPGAHERPAIEYQGIVCTVTEMSDRRIVRVKVSVKEPLLEVI
ncbi:hemolysin family protein [Mesobacillus maritimus]|uniref:HlyC/CorC family transporter n=1 Tax=Mesobacillus maritimus TaxID=1643336 RepID=A0ABS7KAW7_9BACI|nr:hemolysin family protein [Mesobacillus maritimus]MBY0099355.1 HlyC/CorC family transporter [Mesobacillus maritimus]